MKTIAENYEITVLNPFSVRLEKNPFMTMRSKPIFELTDYKIYKYSKEHYVYTYKNIVFAERCGVNKYLIHNIIKGRYYILILIQ